MCNNKELIKYILAYAHNRINERVREGGREGWVDDGWMMARWTDGWVDDDWVNEWMDGWPKSQNICLQICPHFYFHSQVLNINFVAGTFPF